MRIRIIFRRGSGQRAEPELFSDVFVGQQFRWLPLLASAIAHAIVLALIPTLLEAMYSGGYFQTETATYTYQSIRLELPGRVYFPVPHSHATETAAAEKPAPEQRSRPSQATSGAGPRRTAPPSRQLELPETPHVSDQAPVILQPDMTPIPKPAMPAMPPVAFWAKTDPPPARKTFVPGRVHQPSVSPNLDAPPVLSASNPQPVASDIAAALVHAQTTPKLALPNASTNPVRIRGTAGAEIASFDVAQSDPVSLIYLMAENSSARQVEIPKGLQNTPRSKPNGGIGSASGRTLEDSTRSGAAAPGPHDRTAAGSGDAVHTDPSHANEAANGAAGRTPAAAETAGAVRARANNVPGGTGRQSGAAPQGKSPGVEMSATARPLAPAAARAPDPFQNGSATGVIRINHPSNGNFDVVILQSVTMDDLPDVGGALSGNPVYTVYLSVGDAREWLLEYCIPAGANSRNTSYQVNIDDPGVVTAPYPLSTLIPGNVSDLPHPEHIVLHGILSTAGTLREVKATRADNALVREVLPLLSQWEFRPALRDKVPVEVEVLLIIPPRI